MIAPHLSSELVLLGDLNWDMLNTLAILQSKLNALILTQIIYEPTRYNSKSFAPSVSTCTFILCTSYHSSVKLLYCNYFATMAYLLPYLSYPTSFTHAVYRFFYCFIDCMFVYFMCNSVLLYVSNCFALSWPGRSCK
jgi:hypothetical protein